MFVTFKNSDNRSTFNTSTVLITQYPGMLLEGKKMKMIITTGHLVINLWLSIGFWIDEIRYQAAKPNMDYFRD